MSINLYRYFLPSSYTSPLRKAALSLTMIEPQQVPTALQDLANSFSTATSQFQGTTPTSNAADEKNIADSFVLVGSIFPFHVSILRYSLIGSLQLGNNISSLMPNLTALVGSNNLINLGSAYTALGLVLSTYVVRLSSSYSVV